MTNRKTVMISSTALDLPKHRDQVRLACERAGFAPHDMMEHLPAMNANAVEVSLRMVEQADVYVGVLAYRYGTEPEGHDLSITEMEFNRAVELGKPRLMFFIHKDHPVVIEDVQTGAAAEKLKAFKTRIGEDRVAAFFKSPEDLRAHVVEALTQLGKDLDVKAADGDAVASVVSKLHRTSSIPAPPDLYVAHPYTLLQTRDLVGRRNELNVLTDWVAKPGSNLFGANILSLVAIGGMGKSALAWKWFTQIAPNEMKPLAGRMWWSFYESDATFESFQIRALSYVSQQPEDEVRRLTWQDREALLIKHLREKDYLFVLDGLERILIAYSRMDASRLSDDDLDRRTANVVAGAVGLPRTAAQSFVGQHRLRQTTDPRAGRFLQLLAQTTKSRVLITSRLYPSELQVATGETRPRCAAYFLRGLSDDDALALWRSLSVSGARDELLPIFRSVECHPLLVQALGGVIANDRNSPGDFSAWRAAHPGFDPTSLPLVQYRTHILEFALNGLSQATREALNTIVAFRMPASYATLEALLVGDDKICKSAHEFDQILTELEDRGLIGWDREDNRYDAHPIVRGVVWQLIGTDDRNAVLTALDSHFEPMAIPDMSQVESLAELAPAIERYHTLVSLERFDDAWSLFRDRLNDPTLYRLSANRERVAWLERLFFDKSIAPALSSQAARANALSSLAQSVGLSGQPGRAIPLFIMSNGVYEEQGNTSNLCVSLPNLSLVLSPAGRLFEAAAALRRSLVLSRDLNYVFQEAVALLNFGGLCGTIGNRPLGLNALARTLKILGEIGEQQSRGVVSAFLAELSLLFGEFDRAKLWSERAWELAAVHRYERDFVRAAFQQGKTALAMNDLALAEERLHHALSRARAIDEIDFELGALIAIANLERLRGNSANARARLADLWEPAERGPYPMHLADAYNVLAEIEMASGNKPAAIDSATEAYKRAWCDGPPFAYHWGLQKAKAHLSALGAPEPEMAPFDMSRIENPLTVDEINPKDNHWADPDKLD
jgi:tetratricopeptide (TPR) repeat protein